MIAVTMGDGNGVGPEIILNTYRQDLLSGDIVIVGDASVLSLCNRKLGYGVNIFPIKAISEYRSDVLNVLDLGLLDESDIDPGTISEKVAAASKTYIVRATQLCLARTFQAMVTLPVNKEAIRLTDDRFTGHTELIAEICDETEYTMMLASEKLTVTHVSTHCSMQESIDRATRANVLKIIRITHEALSCMIPHPQIAVAGLNPHAGEGGAFGCQEIDEIAPAVQDAVNEGIAASGPHPADTVFLRASQGKYDAVVCMYHDQGHVPMKLLDFHGGVNVTLGLGIIRTSVDHGTAFDIAYQDIAETGSYVEAYKMAQRMTAQRLTGEC